jgi:hypothetical protein
VGCFRCNICGFTDCHVTACPVCDEIMPLQCLVCGIKTTGRLIHKETPSKPQLPLCVFCRDTVFHHYVSEYKYEEERL